MAVDEGLAFRVRAHLTGTAGLLEKRMFGGLAFLLHGHTCRGIIRDTRRGRVAPDACDGALPPEASSA